MAQSSKPLQNADSSGFFFSKEMLNGDPTAGINFDRLMFHPKLGFIIFEYLLCEATQKYVTPLTSHPSKYWHKNSTKFLYLWYYAKALQGTLYLVNYAKPGTLHEDKIMLMEIQDMDETGIKKEVKTPMTRDEFQSFFRKLNSECINSLKNLQDRVSQIEGQN